MFSGNPKTHQFGAQTYGGHNCVGIFRQTKGGAPYILSYWIHQLRVVKKVIDAHKGEPWHHTMFRHQFIFMGHVARFPHHRPAHTVFATEVMQFKGIDAQARHGLFHPREEFMVHPPQSFCKAKCMLCNGEFEEKFFIVPRVVIFCVSFV